MTPKELYEWTRERKIEDASIKIDIESDSDLTFCYPEIKDVSMGVYVVVVNASE